MNGRFERDPVIHEASQQLTTVLTRGNLTSPDPESGAMDLSALKAAVEGFGDKSAAFLDHVAEDLNRIIGMYSWDTQESYKAHAETVLAAMGRERSRITKRFRNHAQAAIRALGAFPLAGDESLADRYQQLQWSAKQSSKFGSERRANHLTCVRAAMEHLAQVGGYPDVVRMEFALKSEIAADAMDPDKQWAVEDYLLKLVVEGSNAGLVVERNGKRLKSIPKAVRSDPAYSEARELQERLRAQARRLRSGLLEPLLAEGRPISVEDLIALLRLPTCREMVSALIWRTAEGVTGLVEADGADDSDSLLLCDLDGAKVTVTGALFAAHPWDLFSAGTLGRWQKAVVSRRIVQPVRQAFRELYLLTPAEVEAGTQSARFAGHRVSGARAGRLLTARSWRMEGSEYEGTAVRRFGDYEARLGFDEMGHYLSEDNPVTGTVSFRKGVGTVALADVPPLVLSEAMRDVDLIVSVAALGTADRPYSTATVAARGQLLAALADDLGLTGVTVEGSFARVQGKRAGYRVHLGSGSIHVEPAGYLCVVPDSAAAGPEQQVILPFADEDVMTSVILSKVLLLAADDRITDPTITAQIERATAGSETGADAGADAGPDAQD